MVIVRRLFRFLLGGGFDGGVDVSLAFENLVTATGVCLPLQEGAFGEGLSTIITWVERSGA